MLLKQLIGKTITDIYLRVEQKNGLDQGECFIELDEHTIVDIPYGGTEEVWEKPLDKKAVSIFEDLSDIPVYHVNRQGKTIQEVSSASQEENQGFLRKLMNHFFGKPFPKEYEPYQVTWVENKLRYLKDRKILEYLWYPEETEKGFFLLDNGYLISEQTVAPHGTGLAGLHYYESMDLLEHARGKGYLKFPNAAV